MATPAELGSADAVWLTSSLRGLAEVRTLDGTSAAPLRRTPALLTLLGFPLP